MPLKSVSLLLVIRIERCLIVAMLFGIRTNYLHLINNWSVNFLDGEPLEKVKEFKYFSFRRQRPFEAHINLVIKTTNCSRIAYHPIINITNAKWSDIAYQDTSEAKLWPLNVVIVSGFMHACILCIFYIFGLGGPLESKMVHFKGGFILPINV